MFGGLVNGLAVFFLLATAGGGVPASDVSSLVEALHSPNSQERLQAIDSLGLLGNRAAEAVPALVGLLKDPTPAVRAHVVHALGEIADPSSAAAVAQALADSDPLVRREAVVAVYRLSPSPEAALPSLIKVLEDPDLSVRTRALNLVTEMGKAAVPPLIRALGKPETAYWACLALGEIGPQAQAVVPALTDAARSQQLDVCREAILALGAIGKEAAPAVPVISRALDDPRTAAAATYALAMIGTAPAEAEDKIHQNVQSPDSLLSTTSVWALARLHRNDSRMLRQASESLVQRLKSKDEDTRLAAARALADLSTEPGYALPLLGKALEGADESTVSAALDALAKLGPKAVPSLVAALKYEDLRFRVLNILGRMGPAAQPAVPELAKLLGDPNHRTHDEVLFTLASIGPAAKDAVPAILKAMANEKDPPTRYGAAYALGRIGPAAAEAKPALANLRRNPDETLSLVAFWALAKIDPTACPETAQIAVPVLIQRLGQRDVRQRLEAAAALRCLGPGAKAATAALKKALGDENQLVRDMAADALKAIGNGAP
jgi:HEAT repeat protein